MDGSLHFASRDQGGDAGKRAWASHMAKPISHDALPYCIEIWDMYSETVEQRLALTTHPAIAYAAYYAAITVFVRRTITLRHNGKILAHSPVGSP